jgi:ferritin
MRKVVGTYLTEAGNRREIYEVNNPKIDTDKLIQGQRYLVEYRLVNKEVSDFMTYLEPTPDFRTLVFSHPRELYRTIGIPTMNINNLIEVE